MSAEHARRSTPRGPAARRALFCGIVGAGCALASGCGRSTPAAHDAVLATFGRTGMGPAEFSYPRAAAAAPDGGLYVVDKAARVQRFDADGRPVREWRMPAWDAGKPTGLGVARDGRVYVADTHYSRVVIYSPEGELLDHFGERGGGPGQLMLPTDVAIARDGTIFVSEYGGNDRINRYSPDHEWLGAFAGRGDGAARTERPQSLLIDRQDTLWVADACNHRICQFTLAGQFIGAFGVSGSGPGALRFPFGVEELPDGTLLVAEFGNNRVQRFDRSGRSLGTWGRAGRGAGELAYPWAAVAGRDGRIFVLDSGNNRVQVVASEALGPALR